MGLEVGTYISDLTPAWPTGSENKSQGDDHLRLIKSVVKTTFPNASKPFYFPTVEATSGTITLDATDQNNIIEVDTSGGDVVVNLPSTLGTADKGWSCEVIKVSTDANGAMVTPAAGTILSRVGSTATIRVGILCEPARFVWTGTAWRCYKFGARIGSVESFDGATLPPGYLWPDGSTFTAATFAELNLVLGGNTKRDRRGRVGVGRDDMGGTPANRVTAAATFNGTVLGNSGGAETVGLVAANNGPHVHTGTAASHAHQTNATPGIYFVTATGGVRNDIAQASVAVGITDSSAYITGASGALALSIDSQGSGTPHNNMPPALVENQIIRAC